MWYRNNKPNEIVITTPANEDALQLEMLKHRVGYSEIRTIKADNTSGLRDIGMVNMNDLAHSMTSLK